MRRLLALAALACFSVALGHADVITFDPGFPGTVPSVTYGAVTFTAVGGGGQLGTDQTPNGTQGLRDFNNPLKQIRAAISGGATSVSIDLGDFNQDADALVLRIYDSANSLLSSTTLLINGAFVGMQTLTLSAPNIAFAEFGSGTPSVGGSSVYADNFTFTPAAVPEPGSVILLATVALGALGLKLRRRSGTA